MSVNSKPDDPSRVHLSDESVGEPVRPPAAPDPPPASIGVRALPPQPTAIPRSRLGGLWVVAVFGAVILVLLLVFILQNGQRVEIHLYGAHWNAPLGVALLMAAALGVLLVVVPAGGRIIQLKRAALRLHRDGLQRAEQRDQSASPIERDDPPADL